MHNPIKSPLKSPTVTEKKEVEIVQAPIVEEISETSVQNPERIEPLNADFPAINEISPQNWYRVIDKASLDGVTEQMALNSQFISFDGEDFKLSLNHHVRSMVNPEHTNKLTAAINSLFNSSYTVTITEQEPEVETPRQRRDRIKQERHQAACENLNDDPQVQSLLKIFDAKLDQDSVETLLPE